MPDPILGGFNPDDVDQVDDSKLETPFSKEVFGFIDNYIQEHNQEFSDEVIQERVKNISESIDLMEAIKKKIAARDWANFIEDIESLQLVIDTEFTSSKQIMQTLNIMGEKADEWSKKDYKTKSDSKLKKSMRDRVLNDIASIGGNALKVNVNNAVSALKQMYELPEADPEKPSFNAIVAISEDSITRLME